jgi:hypothetical protein
MGPSQERPPSNLKPRQARRQSSNYGGANFDKALEVRDPSARAGLALSNAQDDKAPYLV